LAVGAQGYFRADDTQSLAVSKESLMAPTSRSRSRSAGKGKYVPPTPAKSGRSASRSSSRGRKMQRLTSASRSQSRGRAGPSTRAVRVNVANHRRTYQAGASSGAVGGRFGGGSRKSFKKQNKMKFKGCNTFVKEYASTVSTTNQVSYLGHATHYGLQMRETMWGALWNRLMEKAAVFPSSPNGSGVAFLASTTVNIQFRSYNDAEIPQIITETYQPGAVSVSQITFVYWAMLPARPWNTKTTYGMGEIKFVRAYTLSTSYNEALRSGVEVRMDRLKVDFYSKSAMKFQNRSITTAGNVEEDDVDNVPLGGISYSGSGAGSRFVFSPGTSNGSFLCDQGTGLISAGATADLNEPPYPAEFNKIRTAGTFTLTPGVIKTSSLTAKGVHFWDSMFKDSTPYAGTGNKIASKLGKFRFFGIEKVMNVNNAVPIIISYEIQTTTMASLKEGFTKVQTSNFASTVI